MENRRVQNAGNWKESLLDSEKVFWKEHLLETEKVRRLENLWGKKKDSQLDIEKAHLKAISKESSWVLY